MVLVRFAFLVAVFVAAFVITKVQADEPAVRLATVEAPRAAAVPHRNGMFLGAAVHGPALDARGYRAALVQHFTAVTPENGLKLAPHWRPGGFDWSEADAIAKVARDGGLGMRLHTLVWEQPDGLLPGMAQLSPETCRARLTDHIRATMDRYADVAVSVDVVNEPLNHRGAVTMTRWTKCLDADVFDLAFRTARAALDARGRYDVALAINEFGTLSPGPKTDALWRLVRDLRARGVPVDTVGFQAHLTVDDAPTRAQLVATFRRFADEGFKVEVTELDVSVASRRLSPAAALARQAQIAEDVVSACLEGAGARCAGVTTWGVTDAWAWRRREVPGTRDTPVLLDEDGRPKPMYNAISGLLAAASPR